MAIWAVAGTATKILEEGVGVSGTAQVSGGTFVADAEGTATADYRLITPWVMSDRATTVAVKISGIAITGLVEAVSIEESTSTLIRTATFTVVDPRACFSVVGSIVRGALPVEIYLTCRDSTDTSEWLAFTGIIESVSDSDAYCPRATIKAVSPSAALYGRSTAGCLRTAPFAGKTRAQLLVQYAASVGVTMDMTGLPAGAIVRQPVDLSGMTIEALLLRYAELEGWYPREDEDGTIEILTESEVVAGRWKLHLGEDRYLSLREDLPNKPTTVLSIGGAQIGEMTMRAEPASIATSLKDWTDAEGVRRATMTKNTSQNGTVMQSVSEEWADYSIKGYTNRPAAWMRVKRETVDYRYTMVEVEAQSVTGSGVTKAGENIEGTFPMSWWQDNIAYGGGWIGAGYYVPTGQLLSTVATTEGWFQPLCAEGQGNEWADGTRRLLDAESFRVVGRTTITQTWAGEDDESPCRLTESLKVVEAFYNPLAPNYLFADETYRHLACATLQETERSVTTYTDNFAAVAAGQTAERRLGFDTKDFGWYVSGYAGWPYGPQPVETWGLIHSSSEMRVGIANASAHFLVKSESSQDGAISYSRDRVSAAIADPEVASSSVPAYTQTPITFTLVAWTNTYPVVAKTETTTDAESMWELKRIAQRRMRGELGLRLSIVAPMVRGLKPWDVVAVTDSARGLTAAKGWVERIRRTADPLNGWMGMDLTVVLFPMGV